VCFLFGSLLAMLAKDLRQEMYPFFPSILHTVVEVMNPREPELVEVQNLIPLLLLSCFKVSL